MKATYYRSLRTTAVIAMPLFLPIWSCSGAKNADKRNVSHETASVSVANSSGDAKPTQSIDPTSSGQNQQTIAASPLPNCPLANCTPMPSLMGNPSPMTADKLELVTADPNCDGTDGKTVFVRVPADRVDPRDLEITTCFAQKVSLAWSPYRFKFVKEVFRTFKHTSQAQWLTHIGVVTLRRDSEKNSMVLMPTDSGRPEEFSHLQRLLVTVGASDVLQASYKCSRKWSSGNATTYRGFATWDSASLMNLEFCNDASSPGESIVNFLDSTLSIPHANLIPNNSPGTDFQLLDLRPYFGS